MTAKEIIASRSAQELKDGDVVNLGIGLPTMLVDYTPEGVEIVLHAELGYTGAGPNPQEGDANFQPRYVVNAGGAPAAVTPGGVFFDSSVSFGIIRGGHVDVSVLGALEVDEKGNLANWIIPGKMVPGMGGAMDLVVGAKKVIIAMEHTNKGRHKILKKCSLPLTAVGVVDLIITEMGVMEVGSEGIVLTELNPEYTLEQIQAATGAQLIVAADLKEMKF